MLTCSVWMTRISIALMLVSMEISVASSTTCVSPTCSLVECSRNTRTCAFHTLPSLPVKTSKLERSLDLTMVTTSGKSKARCSAVNVAHPSAGTHQRQWRPCRRTAHPRTSSSPVRRLTPALPTVLPVPPKQNKKQKNKQTLHTLSLASCTDGHTGTPVHILFKLSFVNLYCISTLD